MKCEVHLDEIILNLLKKNNLVLYFRGTNVHVQAHCVVFHWKSGCSSQAQTVTCPWNGASHSARSCAVSHTTTNHRYLFQIYLPQLAGTCINYFNFQSRVVSQKEHQTTYMW